MTVTHCSAAEDKQSINIHFTHTIYSTAFDTQLQTAQNPQNAKAAEKSAFYQSVL